MACSDGNGNPLCQDVAVKMPDGSYTVRCAQYVPTLPPEQWPDCPRPKVDLPPVRGFLDDLVRGVAILVAGAWAIRELLGDEDDGDD